MDPCLAGAPRDGRVDSDSAVPAVAGVADRLRLVRLDRPSRDAATLLAAVVVIVAVVVDGESPEEDAESGRLKMFQRPITDWISRLPPSRVLDGSRDGWADAATL